MSLEDTLEMVVRRHDELRDKLSRGDQLSGQEFVKASKEFAEMEPIVESIQLLQNAQRQVKDLESMMNDATTDAEMKTMATEEFHDLQKTIPALTRNVQLALLPKDAADEKNAILEVRAGTGGDEAALFAADLFRMYQRYAATQD
jgi:peptide chain release factor 1